MVLGLAPGGSTRGIAYRIADAEWEGVRAYLKEREQPTETYVESTAHVRLADRRQVRSTVYVSDRKHAQWAGDLTLEAQAKLIAGAAGLSGRNIDYLRDLVMHLHGEGIIDREMERLLALVEELERSPATPHAGEIV